MTSKLVAGMPISTVVANSTAEGDPAPVNATSSTVASVMVSASVEIENADSKGVLFILLWHRPHAAP